MDAAPYIPVIIEATRFMFNEVGKWIDHVRKRSGKTAPKTCEDLCAEKVTRLTQQDFAALEDNPLKLAIAVNPQVAETNVYEIEGLTKQIQTHRRNLVDFETAEAEFGPLTPRHVKRGIEHEASAIVEKSEALRSLLEQVYRKRIENS